jgi:hypothetical protein
MQDEWSKAISIKDLHQIVAPAAQVVKARAKALLDDHRSIVKPVSLRRERSPVNSRFRPMSGKD